MATIYTDPPLWLKCTITGVSATTSAPDGSKQWTATLTIPTAQTHGTPTAQYNGLTVMPGMWLGNNTQGYAWKIVAISSQTTKVVTCTIQDVGNWNKNSDPTGGSNGAPSTTNRNGYIFQLQSDGLPGITSVINVSSTFYDSWTDNLLGRFIANQSGNFTGPTGPTGPRAPKYYSEFQFDFVGVPVENGYAVNVPIGIGLAYSQNESVIITNLTDPTSRFEVIIQNYNSITGIADIGKYTNILGTTYGNSIYSINLSGERGSKWYSYPTGPTGPYVNTGRIGDFYIDENTGYVYVRTQ